MKTVSISTSLKHRSNKSVIIEGKNVKFDEKCVAEVDENIYEDLIDADESLKLLDSKKTESDNDYKKELTAMSKASLVELAKTSELPEEEYKDLNKEKLVEYLFGKLTKTDD